MRILFSLAWRNIWRNWRRSFLTVLSILFATFIAVVTRSMQFGTYDANINTVVNMFTGAIQIQKDGFQDNPSLTKSFYYTENLHDKIKNLPGIKGIAPRIYGNGLIGFRENTFGALVFAIDPETEQNVSNLKIHVKHGSYLEPQNKYDIVLGKTLLENLKANIGDSIVLLTNCYDGSMGNLKFRVCGTTAMGSNELDGMASFISLSAGKEIFGMGKRISVLALSVKDLNNIDNVKSDLNKKLAGSGLVALGWDQVLPDLKQSIELDDKSGLLMLFLIIIVVAFGILNTVLMSITERFREFGVLLAIGMKQTYLVVIVFFETLFLTLMGLAGGMLLSWFTTLYYFHHPIIMTGKYAEITQEFGFIPAINFSVSPGIFINIGITILLISLCTYLYPAYRLYRLEALKGIRYT